MKTLLLLIVALFFSSCSSLTPEQKDVLFNAGLANGQKLLDQKVFGQK